MFEIPIEIEAPTRDGETYSAFAPGLPGVVATGQTEAECTAAMREALALHLRGMIEDGEPLPMHLFNPEGTGVIVA